MGLNPDMPMSGEPKDESGSGDFDFRHHLYDTIVLLGGKKEIAGLVKKSMDLRISSADIAALRAYNCELINLAKDRLANINTIKICAGPD